MSIYTILSTVCRRFVDNLMSSGLDKIIITKLGIKRRLIKNIYNILHADLIAGKRVIIIIL